MTISTRIAITGGSGHLGSCLIQLLLSQGYFVNALYTQELPNKTNNNLIWIKGDINDSKTIQTLINGSSVVIHCAGMISIGNKNADEVYRVNVNGTKTIVNECLKASGIRLIHISSSNAVIETNTTEIFDELRPYKTKRDFTYPYTKAKAEKHVLKTVLKFGLDAIIIRPTSIVGLPDYKPSLLGQTILDLKNKKLPAITKGGYNLVDVRDLSQTIINSIKKAKSGEIYLVGGEYFSVKEIAKTANPTKTPIQISLDLLLILMPFINLYQKLFGLKWPITKESIVTLKFAPKIMDISKARKELNHTCRPIKESITDFIDWSEQNKNS